MIADEIETIIIKKLIAKLESSTEHLTQIYHYQNCKYFLYNLSPPEKVCSKSACKCIVQVAYLIFTAYHFNIDIWIEKQPVYFSKHPQSPFYTVQLRYFLEKERQLCEKILGKSDILRFTKIECNKANAHINQITITIIRNIFQKIRNNYALKPSNQIINQNLIVNLFKAYNQEIQPNIKASKQLKLLKCLQTVELFDKYSDLLNVVKYSFVYKFKKKSQFHAKLNHLPQVFQKIQENSVGKNILIRNARIIDEFLLQMMEFQMIFMEKSSTKDYKDSHGLAIGYIDGQESLQGMVYKCKFYSKQTKVQKSEESFHGEKEEFMKLIHYFLEYNQHQKLIRCRIITNLEETPDSIDIMTMYINNTYFQDETVTLQTYQVVQHTPRGHITKKFLAFKGIYRLEDKQHPIAPIFILIQIILLHYLVYFDFFLKKPQNLIHKELEELNRRVKHLKKLCQKKTQKFYNDLFDSIK